MFIKTKLPPDASLFQRLTYPLARNFYYFCFVYLPYNPIKRINKPDLSGPYIWACTHSNFMIDGLPAGTEGPVPTKFLVKSTLFQFPIKTFMQYCGALPLARASDFKDMDPTLRAAQNKATFKTAIAALAAGWPVAIYPEGVSLEAPGLNLPLKPGVARLALSAEDAHDFKLGLRIIPVGLEYVNRAKIGRGLNIRYGKPLVMKDYEDLYRKDAAAAAKQIMDDLLREIQGNFAHFADQTKLLLGKKLVAFGICRTKYDAAQIFIKQAENPEFWHGLEERLKRLEKVSKDLGIPIPIWGYRRAWAEMGPEKRFPRLIFVLLGTPLFFLDLLNSTLPEFFLSAATDFLSIDDTEKMSKRIIMSPVVLGVIYAIQFLFLKKVVAPEWLAGTGVGTYLAYTFSSFALWYIAVHWRRQCKRLLSIFFFQKAGVGKDSQPVAVYRDLRDYLRKFENHRRERG